MAKKWAKFPHPDKRFAYNAADLKKHWPRLHRGDGEPFPKDAAVQEAWRHFHSGEFGAAVEAGESAGGAGINAAVKAQVVYATYLEKSDKAKLVLLEEAAGWAEARCRGAQGCERALPARLRARPLQPGHLGREGLGAGPRRSRQGGAGFGHQARPEARHAHIAYGAYQAEVIDKVGGLVAGVTYGAKKDSAIEHFEKAIKLNPDSAIARIEYANGLIILFGKSRIAEAEKLYREAAAATPADAMERLDVARAQAELD